MQHDPDEAAYDAYYRQVELQWSLARGCQIIVSPIEFEAIEQWHEAGVPLAVVLRAIDLFVEKKKRAKRKRGFLLKDASTTVEKCFKEYNTIHQGEGQENDLLGSKMKTLIRKVRALAKNHPEHQNYVADLTKQLEAMDLKEVITYEKLAGQLSDLEVDLVNHFKQHMHAESMGEIRADIEELMKEEEDPAFFQKLINDAVRAHYGLPRLTLLG